ncbi:dihydroorotase/N-acyl-D-amino-acid deacylase [Bryocella elongata]|uniref:Dihydroorotase/N-acyl-D-amino-acid deacylase n=1 Tax=Bryocella elongata TaxID=863522 RepID=A0A1H6C4H5_9BACT|nr:D-aminoacylase [Bryocella elongata]SEG67256.1 dihydroorotase/N-acyl-D-amino-acid deacylase [Bryocella elongata]
MLLTNALLYDGTGAPPISADVLVEGGLISAIGSFPDASHHDILDLHGAALAPGFIDLHSHSDLQVLENRLEKTRQGITTEVVGNCGFSPYPCGHHAAQLAAQNEGILHGATCFSGAADYLAEARKLSHLVHTESLIGHGALRTAVLGEDANTTASPRLADLEAELDRALAEGAIGFSTGLMYAPGSQAPFAELEALCRIVARHNKLYTTHMRSYSWELLESIDEQLELARRTGCRLQISHLQAVGRDNWPKQHEALARIERARDEGIDVAFDCYPYLAGSTVLTQLLPQDTLSGGLPGLLKLLSSSSGYARLEAHLRDETAQAWSDIFLSSLHSDANRALIGRDLASIAIDRNTSPERVVLDLLREEDGRINIVAFNQSDENLRALLTHPLSSIITDGFYVSERPHPRLAGAFPTFLGEYTRQRGWLHLETAIRKITSQPAERLGLHDRGRIAPGAIADLVAFDPATIGSPATYDHPTAAPVGILHVIKAGRILTPPSS